jgi:hypothetical protein
MAVVLSLVRIFLGLVGAVLLYLFHDPVTTDNLVLRVRRGGKVGARTGLGCFVVGALLQLAAVLTAVDDNCCC